MKKIHTKKGVIGCPTCGGRMSVTLGWPRWFRRYGPPIVLRIVELCPIGCEVGEVVERVASSGPGKLPEVTVRADPDYMAEVWAAALATYWYKSVKLRAI